MANLISVLYVDDEPALLELGKLFLEESDEFSVSTIDSASAALNLLEKQRFDAIISDYQMPGMDGIEFLIEVRKTIGTIPFILFTGKGREEVVIQAINSGADFYLQKGGEPEAQFAELSLKIRAAASRKKGEDLLRESEARFRTIIQSMQFGIFIIDLQTDIVLDVNRKALEMIDGSHDLVIGSVSSKFILPVEPEKFQKSISGQMIDSSERVLLSLCGEKIPIIKSDVKTTLGEKDVMIVSFVDITERKLIDEDLLQHHTELKMQNEELHDIQEDLELSRNQYQDLYDMAPVGYLTIQKNGLIVKVNLTLANLLNLERSTFINVPFTRFIFPDDQDIYYLNSKKFYNTRNQQFFELRLIKQDNSLFWAQIIMNWDQIKKGNEEYCNIIVIDITEKKLMELERARLAAIVKFSNDAIIGKSLDGTIISWNDGAKWVYGYSAEEIVGKNISLLVPPDHPDDTKTILDKIKKGEFVIRYETTRMKKEGDQIDVMLTASPIKDEQNNLIGASTIARDITERKRAVEALKESENKLKIIFDLLPVGVSVLNKERKIIYENPALFKILQLDKTDLDRENYKTRLYIHPDRSVMSPDEFASIRAIREKKAIHNIETGIVLEDSTIIWTDVSAFPISFTDWSVVIVTIDTTKSRKIEETLRESEKMLTDVSEMAHVGGWELDVRTMQVSWTRETYKIHEISEDQKFELSKATIFYDLPGWLTLETALQRCMKKGESFDLELPFTSAKGRHLMVHAKGRAEFVDGIIVKLKGTFQDITERKQVEDKLRESEALLAKSQEIAHVGSWDLDTVANHLTWSDEVYRIFGLSPQEFDATYEAFLSSVHPEERKTVDEAYNRSLREGRDNYEIVHRIVRSDTGEIRFVNEKCVHLRNIAGQIVRSIGMVQDITEQKQNEEKLFKNAEELRSHQVELETQAEELRRSQLALEKSRDKFLDLYEFAPVGYLTLTDKGLIIEVNLTGSTLLGVERNNLINSRFRKFVTEKDSDQWILYFMQIVNHEEKNTCTLTLTRADGSLFQAWLEGIRLIDGDGVITIRIAINDITERKLEEAKFQKLSADHKAIIENAPAMIWYKDTKNNFIRVNPAGAQAFGMSISQIEGKNTYDLFPDYAEKYYSDDLEVINSGKPKLGIVEPMNTASGESLWVQTDKIPLKDENGTITGILVFAVDVTERKELEMEMEYHEKELRKFSTSLSTANKKLTLLSGITRHDINNQLTVLRGFLSLLEMKQPDNTFSEYFSKIGNAAEQISTMIRFTKEYESIGVTEPVWQDCRTLVNTAARDAPLKGVTVNNLLPTGAEVFADPLIVKVFYNLMDNAVRYGGKITEIRFFEQVFDDDHMIVCEDDGDGVLMDEKEKIFERGFGKNTGLGLALSREILDITGITIRETGEPGKGARFEITVPNGKWRYGSGES